MFTATKKHRNIIIVSIVILLIVITNLYLPHQETTVYDTASLIPKAGEILKNFKTDGKIYCHIEGFHNKRYIVCGTSNIHNILTFIKKQNFLVRYDDFYYGSSAAKYAKYFVFPRQRFIFPQKHSIIAKKETGMYVIYLFFNKKTNFFVFDILYH